MARGARADFGAEEVNYLLVTRPEAEVDLTQAFDWYESRRINLGDEFLEEVNARLALIMDKPHRCAEVFGGVRQILTRRFPYKVLYVLQADTIKVIGVIHVRRRPEFWQRRI